MNKFVIFAALAASLVGGCSTTKPDSNIDSQRVAAIDRAAQGRGVQVIWLAYPQRKAAVAAAVPVVPTGT